MTGLKTSFQWVSTYMQWFGLCFLCIRTKLEKYGLDSLHIWNRLNLQMHILWSRLSALNIANHSFCCDSRKSLLSLLGGFKLDFRRTHHFFLLCLRQQIAVIMINTAEICQSKRTCCRSNCQRWLRKDMKFNIALSVSILASKTPCQT